MSPRLPAADLIPFVKRFEASIPAVARDITDQIWAEIPGYASLTDGSDRTDVEEAAQRNVAAFVRALGEGKDLSKRDIDDLGAVGAQRAYQQIPLEDVLRAFRMVGRVLWDHLAREMTSRAGGPGMDVVIELGGTLMRFTDEISSSVAHHYSIAQRSIIRQQEAARREFLHDLLMGSQLSPDEMLQRARAYGYDLARPQVALVAHNSTERTTGSDEADLARAMGGIADKLQMAGQPMVDRRAGQTIGLFATNQSLSGGLSSIGESLVATLGDGWKIGLGGPYPGPDGCRRSYLEAREALEIGSILKPEDRSYPFETYLLYRFLRTDPHLVSRFIDAVIGAVVDHDDKRRSELVKTLEAYFATDGSAKDAGKILYAHPHTVTYRLKQIERLTGRSLREPEDKLHLHLAVKALRLKVGAAESSLTASQDESAS